MCHNVGCKSYGKVIKRKTVEDGFDELLKINTLKKNVDVLVKKVFEKAWDIEVKDFQQQEVMLDKQKRDLEQKISDLTELMVNAKSELLKRTYEKQIETAAEQLENLEQPPLNEIDLTIPYRTALDKATGLLKNPYSIWEKLDVKEKQQLYYFIFEAKLPFSKTEGYRTAEIPSAIRLFEDFAAQNFPMVEMAGVKPASRRYLPKN